MELTHRLQHWTKSKANKTLKWLPADSEKTFLERLKKDPNNPSLQHYIKHPIEYKMTNMAHIVHFIFYRVFYIML